MPSTRKKKPALTPGNTALRLLIAAAIVAALSAFNFFKPIDSAIFSIQAISAPQEASKDIVFLGLRENPMDPDSEVARKELTDALLRAIRANPDKIFIDTPVPRSRFKAQDAKLSALVAGNASKITFIDRLYDDFEGRARQKVSDPGIRGRASSVVNERYHDFMGLSWKAPRKLIIDGAEMTAAAPAIAGLPVGTGQPFYVDYRYRIGSIPAFEVDGDKGVSFTAADLTGKTVVIGALDVTERIPGHLMVPSSLITILAAETLKGGPAVPVAGWYLTLALGALLAAAAWSGRSAIVKLTHLGLCGVIISAALFSSYLGLRIYLGAPIILLAVSGAILLLNAHRTSARKFDPRFNLPTFEALEDDLADRSIESALVVAKVQNFDTVLAAVGPREQAEYVRRLADRFRVIDPRLAIYSSGSHFAWISPSMARQELESHLLGLRALFSEPITVDEVPIDIGVTFGIDATTEANPSAKIAQARSAADATSQADLPVVFAEANTSPNRIWSLSLQHKVDKALAEGRIFPVYQPQFESGDHRLVGVEALVRWIDEERGVISPAEFIGQCERAGRMEAITRTVLSRSMRELCDANLDGLQLSVNVSATLLHDHRLAKMVRDTLDETGFPPSLLVLEITESWRIADERMARTVMHEIAALGVRWSIDDFGVQSATMETLLKYPFSEIKIDRLFTQAVCTSHKALAMVRMICSFGREMGIDVVAEGAEDRATLRELDDAGCPRVQGFVLARPMSLAELLKQGLQNGRTSVVRRDRKPRRSLM